MATKTPSSAPIRVRRERLAQRHDTCLTVRLSFDPKLETILSTILRQVARRRHEDLLEVGYWFATEDYWVIEEIVRTDVAKPFVVSGQSFLQNHTTLRNTYRKDDVLSKLGLGGA